MPHYRCKNWGGCPRADRRENIELPAGVPAVCPEPRCLKPLVAAPGEPGVIPERPVRQSGSSRGIRAALPLLLLGGGALIAAIGILVWHLGGSTVPPDQRSPPPPEHVKLAADYDLVLVGSNTIGGVDATTGTSLARELLIEFFKKRKGVIKPPREQSLSVMRNGKAAKEYSMTFESPAGSVAVLVRPHGSGTAIEALTSPEPAVRGDIGMSSVEQPELQRSFQEAVVALDAVAVIVNPQNSISELTLSELKDIFGPDPVKTWADVGPLAGRAEWSELGAIHTYGRNNESGTTECFRARIGIRKDLRIPFNGEGGRDGFEDTQTVIDRVAANRHAIGYIGRASSRPPGVKVLQIRSSDSSSAFPPNQTSIATMEYSMARELYFYLGRNPRHLAKEFLDFSMSDDGQKVASDAGFIGFQTDSLVDLSPSLGDQAPRDLVERVARWHGRLRISFRFTPGKDDLDAFSLQNLTRLEKLLDLPENRSRRLAIVGSVDSSGGDEINLIHSRERAARFKDLLTAQGVTNPIAETLGYGKAYLLYNDHGDPNSPEARRNRRVEVYFVDPPQRR